MATTSKTPTLQGLKKGWQPQPQKPSGDGKPTGGYQPTTSEQKPVKPPPKKPWRAKGPNPSLERDLHRDGAWPLSSNVRRLKRA